MYSTQKIQISEKRFINNTATFIPRYTELQSLSMHAHVSIKKSGSEVLVLVYKMSYKLQHIKMA
jgi:hypothetical protein